MNIMWYKLEKLNGNTGRNILLSEHNWLWLQVQLNNQLWNSDPSEGKDTSLNRKKLYTSGQCVWGVGNNMRRIKDYK